MLGVAPQVPSKDPAIVRRRSRGSLPRLHLDDARRRVRAGLDKSDPRHFAHRIARFSAPAKQQKAPLQVSDSRRIAETRRLAAVTVGNKYEGDEALVKFLFLASTTGALKSAPGDALTSLT
jgi:hypothetical protein